MFHALSALRLGYQLLEQAECQCQGAFDELHLLEVSMRSLQENPSLADVGLSSFDLIEVTNEEIEVQAKGLTWRMHDEKIQELDEKITALSQP